MKTNVGNSGILEQLNREKERSVAQALCILMFLPSINNFINSVLQNTISIYLEFLTPVNYIAMAFASVLFLYRYGLRKRILWIFLGVFIIGVGITYVLYPEVRKQLYTTPVDLVYSRVNKLFYFCIPALGGAVYLSDYDTFFYKMRNWARTTVIIGILSLYLVYFYTGKTPQYMVYSYFMLLPICVCYEHNRMTKSNIDLFLALIGTLCIVICGARGAIVSLVLYFIFRVFINIKTKVNIGYLIKLLFLILCGVVLLCFYQEILNGIASLVDILGINSRFITKLVENQLFENLDRNTIFEVIGKGIRNNPLGYGLYGDRYVTKAFGYGKSVYAHNIFVELICDFGLVSGGALSLLLCWRIMKILFLLKDKQEGHLLLALLPYGFFQLLFSSSFLENIPFFVIVGMCFFVNWRKS